MRVGIARIVSTGLVGLVGVGLAAAPGVRADAAAPRSVEVVTDPADDQSPKPDIPKSRLDVRTVRYLQGPNGALRVAIHAVDVRAHRASLREFYAVDVSTPVGGAFGSFQVTPRPGGLLVKNLETGRTARTRGDFTVLDRRDIVRFAIPARALGRPRTVSVSVVAGLVLKRTGELASQDSTVSGDPVRMTY